MPSSKDKERRVQIHKHPNITHQLLNRRPTGTHTCRKLTKGDRPSNENKEHIQKLQNLLQPNGKPPKLGLGELHHEI